jgi:hypothetical protein
MARKLVIPCATVVVVVLVLCANTARAILPLEILGLPSPTDVVRLVDNLTRKDSSTSVEIKPGVTTAQGKLLVARMRVEVVMERSSRNWRGPVRVHMTVPTEVSYSVNLTAIRQEHVRPDPTRRLLVIVMPQAEVEEVTPVLAEVKTANTFGRCRFRRMDADASREMQNTMLLQDYQVRARKEGEAHIPEVREPARAALQELLQSLLGANFSGVKVRVE